MGTLGSVHKYSTRSSDVEAMREPGNECIYKLDFGSMRWSNPNNNETEADFHPINNTMHLFSHNKYSRRELDNLGRIRAFRRGLVLVSPHCS